MHRRGFFGKQGSFTSFFSRTGGSGVAAPGGEASIHGGAAGGFRQVRNAAHRRIGHDPCCMICVLLVLSIDLASLAVWASQLALFSA